MPTRVTLLTDFGTRDGYVAAMKGVLATLAPDALAEDAGHDVPPGDVRSASWALGRYWSRYPPGTVHLAVVDPGVGTARRALACEADGRLLVAPDNGLLTRVLASARAARCVAIEDPRHLPAQRSVTFHGRDVFAPAAAHLARGAALDDLGPPVADPLRLHEPEPRALADGWEGEVVAVDRFGNLLTNLPGAWATAARELRIAGRALGVVRTYGEAERGALVALVGSDGLVEVAERDGSAAGRLGVGTGEPVKLARP